MIALHRNATNLHLFCLKELINLKLFSRNLVYLRPVFTGDDHVITFESNSV